MKVLKKVVLLTFHPNFPREYPQLVLLVLMLWLQASIVRSKKDTIHTKAERHILEAVKVGNHQESLKYSFLRGFRAQFRLLADSIEDLFQGGACSLAYVEVYV